MGKNREPSISLSKTIGWFEGISTRTPMTSIGINMEYLPA